jgi:hypothetical protein
MTASFIDDIVSGACHAATDKSMIASAVSWKWLKVGFGLASELSQAEGESMC